MCTAATYKTKDFYFGRTLDYDVSYGNEIVITPRNYVFKFHNLPDMDKHYAMIGMATYMDNYPLYYEAVNEKGLGMGGLNFVGNAFYRDVKPDKDNVTQFEFIPWILGQCGTVDEARALLESINITNIPFSPELPLAQLHWIISDSTQSITVESVREGIFIYDNPVGVLTNNPTFDIQLFRLNNYMGLSTLNPKNTFAPELPLEAYSRGMGGLGLPGDLSSESRFIRAAFTKMNSRSGDSEIESVSQFFHILGSVDQANGLCNIGDDRFEITLYTSCCNTNTGVYYYTTYNNHQITAVDMYKEDLDSTEIVHYPPITEEQIQMQN